MCFLNFQEVLRLLAASLEHLPQCFLEPSLHTFMVQCTPTAKADQLTVFGSDRRLLQLPSWFLYLPWSFKALFQAENMSLLPSQGLLEETHMLGYLCIMGLWMILLVACFSDFSNSLKQT